MSSSLPVAAQRPLLQRPLVQRKLRDKGAAQRLLPPVVRRALAASLTIRFTGRRTVSVLREGQLNSHEEIIMHEGPRTRIEFPKGGSYDGQVIVEDATERRHFLPEENQVRVLPPRPEEGLQRLRAIARDGGLSVENGERIAGYSTVEVTARDAAGNLVQRLSIEPQSGMVLRRRHYDATGTEIGGYVYSKVDLAPTAFAPNLFKIERRGAKLITPYDQLKNLAKQAGYAPLSLPASSGFRLDTVRLVKFAEGRVLAQNYVGPGGRVSLYQLQAAVSPERLRRQGGRILHTLSWSGNGSTFVLVGPQDDSVLARLKGLLEGH